MRTFYIFKIKNDYYKLTKNNPYNLYLTYLNIKMSTKDNLKYTFNEYNSLTDKINKEELSSYLYNKFKDIDGYSMFSNNHMFNNYYTDETTKLSIHNSYMVLKTNKLMPSLLKEISRISNLFVIDFNNEDYYFLKDLGLKMHKV